MKTTNFRLITNSYINAAPVRQKGGGELWRKKQLKK